MMERRPVGRPAIWHKSIVEYVEQRGTVRAREIRIDLGIPEGSLYGILNALVDMGSLVWSPNKCSNYRLIQKRIKAQRIDVVHCYRSKLT